MDEKRRFFRIKNQGEIQAKSASDALEVVDISSTGMLLIKENANIPKKGTIDLNIHNFSINVSYEILKSENNKMVLVFNKEEEINKLFLVLKKLRNENKKLL
jgi:hypothetical protein